MNTSLLTIIASNNIIDQAYAWLCHRRRNRQANDDVWHLRFHWPQVKQEIKSALLNGTYRFSPCRAVSTSAGSVGVWCAQDALVLKAISLVLTEQLSPKLSPHCYHLTGKGLKACIREVKKDASAHHYVCRSDVNSYYATINHEVLVTQLRDLIPDAALLELIEQLLARLDDVGGNLYTVSTGINKGSPLSPLLGAIYLLQMDKVLGEYCAKHDLRYYQRPRRADKKMDDWLILCNTRNQLRTAVRLMNRQLDLVKQTKHPFKTYIGKIKENGFDFLGYRVGKCKEQLGLAWKTWANHLTKLQQLYEHGASQESIAGYVKRWLVWVKSGVKINLNNVIASGLESDLGQTLIRRYRVDALYLR